MDYQYNGIILSKYDIGETDRIYVIYTLESGKIKAIGKGARRAVAKLAGNLEPVTQAEIFVSKTKGMGKITGSIVLNNFGKIKSDLELLKNSFYIFKIIEKLVPEQAGDEGIYKMLREFLESLEKISGEDVKIKAEMLALGFFFKLLSVLGYHLEMEKCVICRNKLKPEHNYFSISRGGAVCLNCQAGEKNKLKINPESIKLIRIFLNNKIGNFLKIKISKNNLDNLKVVAKNSLDWLAN